MAFTLGELATRFGCELIGDADVTVDHVASLENANSSSLSFLSGSAFKKQLAATAAAAVVLRSDDAEGSPTASLVHDNPYACFARIAAEIHPAPSFDPGIDPLAHVAPTANVAASAHIAAGAVVGDRSTIGDNTCIGPGSVVGPDCMIGNDGWLIANVTVVRQVEIGARFISHAGAIIGCDGFGNAMTSDGWIKVPQVGGVRIGDDVEIGANSTIDCGSIGDTIIEDGVRIDNMVHIAHNVYVGAHTAIAAQCGFAGSVVIGKRCMFAGHSGAVGHITICDDVILSAQAMVTKDINEPGLYGSSFAAVPARQWNRQVARFRRLGSLFKRVKKLERGES